MKEIIDLYGEEIKKQIDSLSSDTDPIMGGKDYGEKVKDLNNLTKDYVDLNKTQIEAIRANNERDKICYEHEEQLLEQEKRLKVEKRKQGLDLLGIIVPTAGAIWGVMYTWYKEQEGINASSAGRAMTNSLLKFLKR